MIDQVAELLGKSRRVLFITGAGISADSGLPTYRGVGGLYDEADTEDGLSIEEALSGPVLQRRPDITWKYLAQIGRSCRGASPNAAHRVIADLERLLSYVMVFTQNVDGLHRDAGSSQVVEIHGNMRELFCSSCGHELAARDIEGAALPPLCPRCRGPVRPRVVLFGEMLPLAALERFERALEEGFDLVFSIGTSSRFPYVSAPILWAHRQGIPTVEINPGDTELSAFVDYPIKRGAAAAMEAIWGALIARRGAA